MTETVRPPAAEPQQAPGATQAEIESLRGALEEARDEAELNLLQLQQVQEELEFYFLAHQEQQSLLERSAQEQQRAEALIAALLERLDSQAGAGPA